MILHLIILDCAANDNFLREGCNSYAALARNATYADYAKDTALIKTPLSVRLSHDILRCGRCIIAKSLSWLCLVPLQLQM
jgi:hypothetical protein